jgi:phage gp36-like protein
MPLLSTVYCTVEDMERLFSTVGVTAFSDHDEDTTRDVDVVEDCINQASQLLDFYLRHAHSQAQIASSTLVNRWCTVMAVRYLCQRRGNGVPESVELEWADEIKPLLEELRKDREALPGIDREDEDYMTMSNLRVDRRFNTSTIRVTPSNSSRPSTKLTQDLALDPPSYLD